MTEQTHLFFIINQTSRKGNKAFTQLEKILKTSDYSYSFYLTEAPKHAKTLVQTVAKKINTTTDRLIVVGGDGTLSEVINGLQFISRSIPIGYIPSGSGNDFARSHHLTTNVGKALKRMLSTQYPTELDLLKVKQNGIIRYAINSTGVGLDGTVINYVEEKRRKERIGSFSYFSALYTAIRNQQPFRVHIETQKENKQFEEALLAIALNHKYTGGGINVHPQTSPVDGLIHVVIVEKLSFFEVFPLLFKLITGGRHIAHKKIHTFLDAEPIVTVYPAQFGQQDGENVSVPPDPLYFSTKKQSFWL